jgi:hypothetical protein
MTKICPVLPPQTIRNTVNMAHHDPRRGAGKTPEYMEEHRLLAVQKEAEKEARRQARLDAGEEVLDSDEEEEESEPDSEEVEDYDTAPNPAVAPTCHLTAKQINKEAMAEYTEGIQTIHVRHLLFDREKPVWGQLRRYDPVRVKRLQDEIATDPPRVTVSGLLFRRLNSGM